MVSKWLSVISFQTIVVSQLSLGQSEIGGYRPPEGQPDTLHTENRAEIGLEKLLDTYHWTGITTYNNVSGPWSLQLNEQFHSTVILNSNRLTRDEQSVGMTVNNRWTDDLQGSVQLSSYSLSDNQNITIGSASSHGFYSGIAYEPTTHVEVMPMIGYRFDNQISLHDKGISYEIGVLADSLNFGGYRTDFNARTQYDNLAPRASETRNALLTIQKIFAGQSENVFQVFYSRNRRDFYNPADPVIQQQYNVSRNIETRNEDAYTVSDTLDYPLEQALHLTFQSDVFTRQVSRELRYEDRTNPHRSTLGTTVDELNLDGSILATYHPGTSFNGLARFFYQERDEQHGIQPEQDVFPNVMDSLTSIETSKNNHARRTLVSMNLEYIPSQSNSIAFSGSAGLLRYDTPSHENDDDRDELRYTISLEARHRFNRYFNLRLLTEANMTHLVYIMSTRSADNTWNRIFRLSPRLDYASGSGIMSANAFEVLANYTVYDFEYSLSPIRSFAFREFGFIDSSSAEITNRLAIEWFSKIRLYERGELQWQEFAERPLNYFEDKTYIGTMRYAFREYLTFSFGIRYFSQLRFAYQDGNRKLESALRSIGPLAEIWWKVGRSTQLHINGWYENQSFTAQPNHSFANMSASLTVLI